MVLLKLTSFEVSGRGGGEQVLTRSCAVPREEASRSAFPVWGGGRVGRGGNLKP